MLRRRTGPRRNARVGRPKPSSAIVRPPTVPVDLAPKRSCRRGTPRWPRPDSPRRVYGSRLLRGPKHLRFRCVLLPSTVEGSFGARGPRSSDRALEFPNGSESLCSVSTDPGHFRCLWSRLLNRCPPSSEEAPSARDQRGLWDAASQGRSSDRASPLFAPLPVPPRTDTFVTAS